MMRDCENPLEFFSEPESYPTQSRRCVSPKPLLTLFQPHVRGPMSEFRNAGVTETRCPSSPDDVPENIGLIAFAPVVPAPRTDVWRGIEGRKGIWRATRTV
jgi:hypothetical protein